MLEVAMKKLLGYAKLFVPRMGASVCYTSLDFYLNPEKGVGGIDPNSGIL